MVLLVSSSNMSLFDITNYLVSKSFTNLRMFLSSSVLTLNVGTRLIWLKAWFRWNSDNLTDDSRGSIFKSYAWSYKDFLSLDWSLERVESLFRYLPRRHQGFRVGY